MDLSAVKFYKFWSSKLQNADLELDRVSIDLKKKFWIQVRIETDANSQHWYGVAASIGTESRLHWYGGVTVLVLLPGQVIRK